jgi:hypothetical protein
MFIWKYIWSWLWYKSRYKYLGTPTWDNFVLMLLINTRTYGWEGATINWWLKMLYLKTTKVEKGGLKYTDGTPVKRIYERPHPRI